MWVGGGGDGARRTRSRVVVTGTKSQWNMDLMDMVDLFRKNDEYKYVLVAIDISSRFAHCQSINSKEEVMS